MKYATSLTITLNAAYEALQIVAEQCVLDTRLIIQDVRTTYEIVNSKEMRDGLAWMKRQITGWSEVAYLLACLALAYIDTYVERSSQSAEPAEEVEPEAEVELDEFLAIQDTRRPSWERQSWTTIRTAATLYGVKARKKADIVAALNAV